MQLLRSLEQINKEVRKEIAKEQKKQEIELPEWKKEFERIQDIVWEKGREERKKWVLEHKLKHKIKHKTNNKQNKKIWLFKRMADEYSTYIY